MFELPDSEERKKIRELSILGVDRTLRSGTKFSPSSAKTLNDDRRMAHLSTVDDLKMMLDLSDSEVNDIEKVSEKFPMKIPKYYSDLLKRHEVLRKVVVPSTKELVEYEDDGVTDVHADESKYQPVEGIVHRYPGKLLFLPTLQCFGHCRFCFRSAHRIKPLERVKRNKAFSYIRSRTDIREVIVTGGDPLTLPIQNLEEILATIYAIDHVEVIRLGTRALAFAPQVITKEMVSMLAKYKPLYMALSFVHPDEITPYCEEKLNMLADSGIVMLQQGPVLRGINDDARVLKQMYEKLAQNRVLAYHAIYGIYAPGIRHFMTNREKAKKLLMELENNTSGYCLPQMITLDQNNNKSRSVA